MADRIMDACQSTTISEKGANGDLSASIPFEVVLLDQLQDCEGKK